jgi:hypothetical protein
MHVYSVLGNKKTYVWIEAKVEAFFFKIYSACHRLMRSLRPFTNLCTTSAPIHETWGLECTFPPSLGALGQIDTKIPLVCVAELPYGMGHGPYYRLFLKISLIFILNFQIILKVVKFLHLLTQKTKKRWEYAI